MSSMKRPGSKKYGTRKALGVILVVGLVAAGTYAFTATNTVAASKAGDGAAAITGYNVTNVTYTQNPVDPTLLATYTFTLDAAASSVDAKVVSGQLTYDNCVGGLLNSWTCTPPAGTTVQSLDNLRVIAVQ